MTDRRAVRLIGPTLAVVAGVVLTAGIIYAAFGPLHTSGPEVSDGRIVRPESTHSLYSEGIGLATGAQLAWFAICAALIVTVGCVGFGNDDSPALRRALCAIGVLTAISGTMLLLTIGWLMLPGALLALLAAASWSWVTAAGRRHPIRDA
ncbi:MAG: hypothetical protein M0R74_03540 [Dehalococcoidia bacterium]|nr:hypothetical protein [Dehalococcoidia bacterium]